MKKSLIAILVFATLLSTGCTNSQTKMLIEQQNQEVLALQKIKMDI